MSDSPPTEGTALMSFLVAFITEILTLVLSSILLALISTSSSTLSKKRFWLVILPAFTITSTSIGAYSIDPIVKVYVPGGTFEI